VSHSLQKPYSLAKMTGRKVVSLKLIEAIIERKLYHNRTHSRAYAPATETGNDRVHLIALDYVTQHTSNKNYLAPYTKKETMRVMLAGERDDAK
jgi:hypothetical protein